VTLPALLAALHDALVAEQAAVRALDGNALEAHADTKLRLVAELRGHDLRHAGREELALAARVHALAHANHLLIEEAAQAIGRRRGVIDAGVYDARARRVRGRVPTGRAI
jgi:Ser/Thr protein kinase RdoA (MazF antagonist)